MLRGHPPLRPHGAFLNLALLALLLGAAVPEPDAAMPLESDLPDVDSLQRRTDELAAAFDTLLAGYEADARPIERALAAYHPDTLLVRQITAALVRHARDNDIEPAMLAGVLLVENPWLKPDTMSFVGATGLMQVMPFHAGGWGCASSDLTDIDSNICHGARILAWNLAETRGDLERALLRYNGCVRGTNTPDCHRYPSHVRRLAARVRGALTRSASRQAS